MQEMQVGSLGWEYSLEEGIATHSSILAWRIPMDRRDCWAMVHTVAVGHSWSNLLCSTYEELILVQLSWVQSFSIVQLSLTPQTAGHQDSLSPTPGACSNSCPSSWWCHPTVSSSAIPFSSCFQSSPASGSFPMSQFFTRGAKVLEFQLQHQSFQWIFRTDFL